MASVPSTPTQSSVRHESDEENIVQSIEVVDLTKSPSVNEDLLDQSHHSIRETPAIAALPQRLREFYHSIHHHTRPAFMQDFAAKLEQLKIDRATVDVMLSQQESNMMYKSVKLEELKRQLCNISYESSQVRTVTREIAEAERIFHKDRKVIDHLRSWRGYQHDCVEYTKELYNLWGYIWDWVEDDLLNTVCMSESEEESAEESEDEDIMEADMDPEDTDPTTEAATLHRLLMEVELKFGIAKEAAHSHGRKVIELMNMEG